MKEPQTLKQAIEYFSDDATCFEYVVNLRWANGVAIAKIQILRSQNER